MVIFEDAQKMGLGRNKAYFFGADVSGKTECAHIGHWFNATNTFGWLLQQVYTNEKNAIEKIFKMYCFKSFGIAELKIGFSLVLSLLHFVVRYILLSATFCSPLHFVVRYIL